MSFPFDEEIADCGPISRRESLEFRVVFAWRDPADQEYVYLGQFQVETLTPSEAYRIAHRCLDDPMWLKTYVFEEGEYIDDLVIGDVVVLRNWERQLT